MVKTKLFKRLGLTFLVLCAAISVCTFAGCVEETWISREISAEEEEKICAVFSESKYTNSPVDTIYYYYGNYHNTYVACMGRGQADVVSTEEVDEITFYFGRATYIFAFRNNKIYTMQEAFDKNYLSHSDIEDIHAISLEQHLALE